MESITWTQILLQIQNYRFPEKLNAASSSFNCLIMLNINFFFSLSSNALNECFASVMVDEPDELPHISSYHEINDILETIEFRRI